MKKIAILGSTGSIGTQTLEVVRENGDIEVLGLAAGSNIKMLEEQIREFHPQIVAVWSEEKADELRVNVADTDTKIVAGMDGLMEVATMKGTEILVTAVVGMIGIRPTIEAIKAGKDIALANKETLVTAGHIIMPLAKKMGVSILPVDSEHSAIFQSLQGNNHGALHKILLTASGGPFRGKKSEELMEIKVEDALKHPNWSMGRKITIDSSTMVNKGLEVIEAKWLFNVDVDQVQVVVQPQSIIHSMVEYVDGAIIAELGTPDMKLPIQYALYYPERRFLPGDRVDFWTLGKLEFEKPDTDTFYGLELAYEAGRKGGSLPTVFNAANELAVSQFLNREIKYLEITEIIEDCMKAHKNIENPTLEQILETEAATYERINSGGNSKFGNYISNLIIQLHHIFFMSWVISYWRRKNGIDVDEFAIGMGPAIYSKEYKGTKYAVRILPIGGFCAMGEDEEANDSPNNFNNKSVWARISVIAAGPVFNFILAFIFAVIITAMVGYDKPVIGAVESGYPAAEAGLKKGDEIVQMGNKKIHIFREVSFYNQFHSNEDVAVTVLRNGKEKTVTLTPKMDKELGYKRLGIGSSGYSKANLLTAFQYGGYEVKFWICTTVDSLKMLVTGQIGVNELSGPVGIVSTVDTTYKESRSYGVFAVVVQMLNMAILLSANLGVMNLLPLPALDGDVWYFFFVEAIRGKRVPPEKEGYVHLAGIILLMLLMVFVMFNDINRIFLGR